MIAKIRNKKGVSEVVTYVLLIVVAIGISIAVFSYLSVFTPKEKIECTQEFSLILQNADCLILDENDENNELDIKVVLSNKGKYTIDAAFLRLSKEGRKVKSLVLNDDPYLGFTDGLKPGKSHNIQFILQEDQLDTIRPSPDERVAIGKYSLEIEPATSTDKGLALCSDSLVTQEILCDVKRGKPIIRISRPTINENTFFVPDTIQFIAELEESDLSEEIAKVELFEKREVAAVWDLIASSNPGTRTYSFSHTIRPRNPPTIPGDSTVYEYDLVVTDSSGDVKNEKRSITYKMPGIPEIYNFYVIDSETGTADDGFILDQEATLLVESGDTDGGDVRRVDFYYMSGSDENLIGSSSGEELLTRPGGNPTDLNFIGHSFTWTPTKDNFNRGPLEIIAKAIDNDGFESLPASNTIQLRNN